MSNSDILEQELKELESSLVFEDAEWIWDYNVDLARYDILIVINSSNCGVYRTYIEQDMVDDLKIEEVKSLVTWVINNLYNVARAQEVKDGR